MGHVGPRWAPCGPRESCYQGIHTRSALEGSINSLPEFVSNDAYGNGLARHGNDMGQNSIIWYSDTIDLWPINGTVHATIVAKLRTEPWFNTNMLSYQYRKSHCGDKTVVRLSYLHNAISYTGKMTSKFWIRAQTIWSQSLQSNCLCV